MNGQILVPLDGSARAELILPQAAALAHVTARSLRLLLIELMPDPVFLPALIGAIPIPISEHPHWPRSYLASVARQLTEHGVMVQADVVIGGDIGATILECARDPMVDLIAMATHGRSGVEHWLMGSVAEQVLHAAPRPLLLFPGHAAEAATPPTKMAYRTILVPLDGSAFAAQALGAAHTLAATTGATLVLLGVVPTMDDIGLAEGGITPLWMLAECQAHEIDLQHALDAAAAILRADGLVVRTTLLKGIPADSIVRACAIEAADLLIMATHGRSGLRRLVLGSVAAGVVRHADVPILLIRPQERPRFEPATWAWWQRPVSSMGQKASQAESG